MNAERQDKPMQKDNNEEHAKVAYTRMEDMKQQFNRLILTVQERDGEIVQLRTTLAKERKE